MARLLGTIIVAGVLALGAPAVAGADSTGALAALAKLEPGQWEFRPRDPDQQILRLCVSDLTQLLQLRHQGQACSRFVVTNDPKHVTITYSCPHTGHGHTDLRVETPRLVELNAQGIADGMPFAMDLEGRRISSCSPLLSNR